MNKEEVKELIGFTIFMIPFVIITLLIVVALFSTVDYGLDFLFNP